LAANAGDPVAGIAGALKLAYDGYSAILANLPNSDKRASEFHELASRCKAALDEYVKNPGSGNAGSLLSLLGEAIFRATELFLYEAQLSLNLEQAVSDANNLFGDGKVMSVLVRLKGDVFDGSRIKEALKKMGIDSEPEVPLYQDISKSVEDAANRLKGIPSSRLDAMVQCGKCIISKCKSCAKINPKAFGALSSSCGSSGAECWKEFSDLLGGGKK
jgi:hypothetical protein